MNQIPFDHGPTISSDFNTCSLDRQFRLPLTSHIEIGFPEIKRQQLISGGVVYAEGADRVALHPHSFCLETDIRAIHVEAGEIGIKG